MNSPATLVPPSTFTVNYTLSNEYTQFPQYWVVETDYDNYAILYGCKLLSSGSHMSIYHHIYTYDFCTKNYSYPNLFVFSEMMWVLTRAKLPLYITGMSYTIIEAVTRYVDQHAIKLTDQISPCDED